MYICLACNSIFEHPKRQREYRGECFGFPAYEECSCCPYCGGNYTTAHECDSCGEYITGTYAKLNNGERICENCYTTHELGDED